MLFRLRFALARQGEILGDYESVLKVAETVGKQQLWECVCDWQLFQVLSFSQMHCRCNY